eukprot:Pgem_evm1s18514
MGNESCDVDSMVCALAYALHLYSLEKKKASPNLKVVPLMTIPRADFNIRPE